MDLDGTSSPAKTLDAIGAHAAASSASSGTATPQPSSHKEAPLPNPAALPEHEAYLSLLVLLVLLDRAVASKDPSELQTGFDLSTRLTGDYLALQNRRSLDPLAAKIWFYHSRFAELLEAGSPSPSSTSVWDAIRPALLAAHRTATLRRDEDTQATVLNLLVRNYLGHDLWDQADRLVGKSEFPEFGMGSSVGVGGHVPAGQVARWLYYIGARETWVHQS